MKYEIKPSSRFKRDMKLVKKRGYDQRLIEMSSERSLPVKNWTKSTETIFCSVTMPVFTNVILRRTGC